MLHFIKHLIFPPYKTDLHGISVLKTIAPASRINASHLGPTESVPGPWEVRPLGLFVWRGCHVCETILSAWNPMSFVLITRNTMRTRCPHCGTLCVLCAARDGPPLVRPREVWPALTPLRAPRPAPPTPHTTHHTQNYISFFNSAAIYLCCFTAVYFRGQPQNVNSFMIYLIFSLYLIENYLCIIPVPAMSIDLDLSGFWH